MLMIIVGSAACVRADLAALRRLLGKRPWPTGLPPVIAINRQISDFAGDIVAGVTLHPENAPDFRAGRQQQAPWKLWTGREGDDRPGVDRTINRHFAWHGTSAAFAVQVGLEHLGATKLVLVGCPIDATPHYDGPHTLDDRGRLNWYREGWTKMPPHIRARVRSMSGWSADYLGAPDKEWLRA